jgi:hypothetical protein
MCDQQDIDQSELIERIISNSGGVRPLARKLTELGKRTAGANIHHWRSVKKISPSWVPYVSSATGIPEEELNPYPALNKKSDIESNMVDNLLWGNIAIAISQYPLPSIALRTVNVIIGHSLLNKSNHKPLTLKRIQTKLNPEPCQKVRKEIKQALDLLVEKDIVSHSVFGVRDTSRYEINTNIGEWSEALEC